MDQKEMMKLNIQLFADVDGDVTPPETDGDNSTNTEAKTNETPTFTDLLKNNPGYQSEFDKLVGKSLETAKSKWQTEYDAKLEAEKSEAEKLAKMDADQKVQYELDKARKEKEELQSQLNAINLYKTASTIATEKELPVGYLDLIDFSKETAETITEKMDKLQEIREKDLQTYLNSKLKQKTPEEKSSETNEDDEDPYIKGFKSA